MAVRMNKCLPLHDVGVACRPGYSVPISSFVRDNRLIRIMSTSK